MGYSKSNPRGNPSWGNKKTRPQDPTTSGNPNGRPLGSGEMGLLREAVSTVEVKKKKTLYTHFAERAYLSDTVLIAIVKKFVPDLKSFESLILGTMGGMTEAEAKEVRDKLLKRFEQI